jgi:hypothetical protein
MTLKLDRSDCARLAIACTTLQQALEREAADAATTAERREIAQSSAAAWGRLHDEIRAQLDDWDRKQAERAERGRRV